MGTSRAELRDMGDKVTEVQNGEEAVGLIRQLLGEKERKRGGS